MPRGRSALRIRILLACLLCALFPAGSSFGQWTTLSGRVFDATDGAPLPGVNLLVLSPDSQLVAGTVTRENGRFEMMNLLQGDVILVARYVGYRTDYRDLRLRELPSRVILRLQPDVVGLGEVDVTAGKEDDPADTRTSVFRIDPAQALQLAGGGDDVIRVLQTLPGVLATSDFSNQLIVRGGNPDQNLILLDGIEVFNPYRLNGMASMFNPSIVREVELYTGGFPAAYGDRLSSVLDVSLREGTRDRALAGDLNISLSTANLVLEGKTAFWDGSWLIGGRRTYFDLVSDNITRQTNVYNDVAYPDFLDVQAKIVLRPARAHRLQLQGLFNRDRLDWLVKEEIGEQGEEFDRLDGEDMTRNELAGASWTYAPTARLRARVFSHWYRIRGASDFAGELVPSDELIGQSIDPDAEAPAPVFGTGDEIRFAYEQAYAFRKTALGTVVSVNRGAHAVDAGAGVDFLRNRLDLTLDVNPFGRTVFEALQSAPNWFGVLADSVDRQDPYRRWTGYVQDRVNLLDGRLFVQPGARYAYFEIAGRGYVSPRLNVSYAVDSRTTVRAAVGRVRQSPGYEKLLDEGEVFNLARFRALEELLAESATHYVLGLNRRLGARWNLKLEGYWKSLHDLIVQRAEETLRLTARYRGIGSLADPDSYSIAEENAFRLSPEPVNDAEGEAFGFEVLLEKRFASKIDRWSGWASYAFARADREQTVRGERVRFPFDYDRRHALNVVFNYKFGGYFRWILGVTWRYGTGFPYTPAVGMEPLVGSAVNPDNPDETVDILLTDDRTGDVRFVPIFGDPSNVNSGRLPDYHRLDVRFTYTGTWVGRPLEFYVDLINVYRRKNVLYYRNLIQVEEIEGFGQSERTARPVLYREPVYMLPFVPSLGVRLRL